MSENHKSKQEIYQKYEEHYTQSALWTRIKEALTPNGSVVSENSKNYTENFGLGFKFLDLLIQKFQSLQNMNVTNLATL